MNSQSRTASHNSNWKLLGDIDLPLGTGQNQTIHEWLDPLLESLNLHEDILHRVVTSVREAATHAAETYERGNNRHIHIRIYLTANRTPRSGTWSFFRLEKFEEEMRDGLLPDHVTELYLYQETHQGRLSPTKTLN